MSGKPSYWLEKKVWRGARSTGAWLKEQIRKYGKYAEPAFDASQSASALATGNYGRAAWYAGKATGKLGRVLRYDRQGYRKLQGRRYRLGKTQRAFSRARGSFGKQNRYRGSRRIYKRRRTYRKRGGQNIGYYQRLRKARTHFIYNVPWQRQTRWWKDRHGYWQRWQ